MIALGAFWFKCAGHDVEVKSISRRLLNLRFVGVFAGEGKRRCLEAIQAKKK